MNKILSNPPKLIVLLKFPDYIIDMHEYLFRKSQISGQRHLYNAIFNLVNQKKYVIAKTYKDEFYNFNSNFEKFVANKKDKQYLANLDKKIRKENNNFSKIEKPYYSQIMKHNEKIEKLYAEKLVICEKYRKLMNIDKHRYFLPDGYEMFILIRSDIYKGN